MDLLVIRRVTARVYRAPLQQPVTTSFATVVGDGVLEIDANPNPLRSLLCGPLGDISNGKAELSDQRWLGHARG